MKHLIVLALLCLVIRQQVRSQDLICSAINVARSGSDYIARVKISNIHQRKAMPVEVYLELHTANSRDAANPIAQLRFDTTSLGFRKTILITRRVSAFSLRQGALLANARKLVVICDPKNKVNEIKENNNRRERNLP